MVPAVEMKNRVAPGIGAATYYLHTIVTLPSERGRGLGKALLRQMEFIAKAKGKQMGLGAMSHSDVSRCLASPRPLMKLGASCLP